MTDMQVFEYEGMAEVRTIVRDGEPMFAAPDVCRVLGTDPSNVGRVIPASERGLYTIQTLGGQQDVVFLTEPGLYRMIFKSRKPEAEAFKTWVVSDVLPSIRKTGGYLSPEVDFNDPHKLMVLLENWAADRERAELAEAQLTIESAKVAELSPRASAFDSYLDDVGDLNLRRVMGIVRQINPSIKEQWVTGLMRDLGYVERYRFAATAKAVHAGYMANKGGMAPNGTPWTQGRFTPKGVRWLLKAILGNGDARRVSDAMLDELAENLTIDAL